MPRDYLNLYQIEIEFFILHHIKNVQYMTLANMINHPIWSVFLGFT